MCSSSAPDMVVREGHTEVTGSKSSPLRSLAYSGVLVGLGVGVGYALAWVPNVELISFTAALSGYILGAVWGAFDGATMFLLYSFFSPFGVAPLPQWIAQGVGGAAFGLCGATLWRRLGHPVVAAAVGAAATAFYDLITNAAGYFAFPTKQTFAAYMISGIAFSALHIAANAVVFALLFPLISRRVPRGVGDV